MKRSYFQCARWGLMLLIGWVPVCALGQTQPETSSPTAEARVGGAGEVSADEQASVHAVRYFLERVEVRGNTRTRSGVVRRFVPLHVSDVLDPNDPEIEYIRWRLLGTGWFDDVQLRLRRGSRRGWVVLVIEVRERNTILIQQATVGVSRSVTSSTDRSVDLVPYFGASVAETNLLGTGMSLSATGVVSKPQQGVRFDFLNPSVLGSRFLLTSSLFFNNAREFFGNDPLVSIRCPEDGSTCPPEVQAKNAVVFYKRWGFSLGTGHDLGASTRYTLEWQGDIVDVGLRPDAASFHRGTEIRPIDFSIDKNLSFVSTLRVGVVYDRRNDPALPSRGLFTAFRGDVGSKLIGSDYDFFRLQGWFHYWLGLPWKSHYMRFGLFAGVAPGRTPFFYQFHISDLSDLIPSRMLEMNLDRRSAPNLLGTAIADMRIEELAGRFDIEYGMPLYRGSKGVRAVNAFATIGLWGLADIRDLKMAVPGFRGASRIPVDLTFDFGVRIDTTVGVFQIGLSNVLGFVEL